METKELMDLAADGFEIQEVEEEQHGTPLTSPFSSPAPCPFRCRIVFRPTTPSSWPRSWLWLGSWRLRDNPDAPEDDAYDDYADECSSLAWKTAEADWDRLRNIGC